MPFSLVISFITGICISQLIHFAPVVCQYSGDLIATIRPLIQLQAMSPTACSSKWVGVPQLHLQAGATRTTCVCQSLIGPWGCHSDENVSFSIKKRQFEKLDRVATPFFFFFSTEFEEVVKKFHKSWLGRLVFASTVTQTLQLLVLKWSYAIRFRQLLHKNAV